MIKTICVFCGSRKGNDSEYSRDARELGHLLAKYQIGLVYGAGNIGLMGVVADACLEMHGKVTGVIPGKLVEKEVAHHCLTELVVVESMHERKALMAARADAFLALPGGFGTCDELFEIITWAQLGIHAKPVGILNTAGFFDPLLHWIDHMVNTNFINPKYRNLILVGSTPAEALDKLLSGPRLVLKDIEVEP